MKTLYIYVCYPITDKDDEKGNFIVNWSDEMESFITMKEAVEFCKGNYAQHLISIEKCDEEVYQDIKGGR